MGIARSGPFSQILSHFILFLYLTVTTFLKVAVGEEIQTVVHEMLIVLLDCFTSLTENSEKVPQSVVRRFSLVSIPMHDYLRSNFTAIASHLNVAFRFA